MFTLPPATLAAMRSEANQAMQQSVTFYSVTITRDVYGRESVQSGILGTYPCYIVGLPVKQGYKEEEMVQRIISAGIVKERLNVCLLPHNAFVSDEAIAVVAGEAGEWVIVHDNYDVSPNHRIYSRLIIMRRDETTNYKDRIGKNRM